MVKSNKISVCIIFLGVYALVEIMRIKQTDLFEKHSNFQKKSERYFLMKKNVLATFLAGRYFASECKADLRRSANELGTTDDFRRMQETLDRLYPNMYQLNV